MTICMNIIYTAGTVHALARFVPLLVANTPWRFRLVSNHCAAGEDATLRALAESDDRLDFRKLHTTEVIPLGKALSALYRELPPEDTFGFMDSDIVVVGDIAAEFEGLLDRFEAVFSGTPIWATPSDQVLHPAQQEVAGPHNVTADGVQLGSSYFGIYRRETMDRVVRECDVLPDKYTDVTHCAPAFQRYLAEHGLLRRDYVPPKLLNIAYSFLQLPIAYHDSPWLHHIGGYSMATYRNANASDEPTASATTAAEILDFAEERSHMRRKIAVCERFIRSFAQIDRGSQPEPSEPFADASLETRVRLIEDLYARQAPVVTGSHPG
ncbi:hypothetical protein AB0J90_05355 [Micromonospora sp. NPDC049523]|uniref:hypothetical protein n=1 Tax=Micromonospora sp. NPDC049523 TaxID=3155921 RepID=UPI003434B29D